jgi:hypothetical protein
MIPANQVSKMEKRQFSNLLREEMSKEELVLLDFSYISKFIDHWWMEQNKAEAVYILKSRLANILLTNLSDEDINYFDNLGLATDHVAAICIKNIFTIDSPKLALTVHEALSELFHIADIKYDYEEHKTLYLKPSAIEYKDWGSGYGEITPHSDDLYESLNIDYLSLTVCRDQTKTATKCFFPKDILKNFNEDELFRLKDIKAKFKSGKNVEGFMERERNILEYSEKYGFRFFLDFRVDNITGQRMKACCPEDQILLDKMNNALENCHSGLSTPETGTFFIVANHKVLHARDQMKISKELAEKFSNNANLLDTPRLLYRSKGPRKEYLNL